MILEPAGNLMVGGLVCAEPVGDGSLALGRLAGWDGAWRVPGARGCTVCASLADHLILLGPGHQDTVLLTGFDHQGTVLFAALAQSITYSHSLKIIAAHLPLPVRVVTACLKGGIGTAVLKSAGSFLHGNQRADGGPAASLQHLPNPSPRTDGLGCLHQHLHAFQPRLIAVVDEWETICHSTGRMCPAVAPQQGPLALPG